MENVAMLWTGGKDSALALHKAIQKGYTVSCLVTFAPENPNFLAHPLSLMEMQAEALGLPHYILTIDAPYDKSYEDSLRWLRDELNIEGVVTGDIDLVQGSANWIRERCCPLNLDVYTPLWECDRASLLQGLIDEGFSVYITCINTRWLDETWVGRELNLATLADLQDASEQGTLDLCGEQGEYHTMVVDGPQFNQRIEIGAYTTRTRDNYVYMDIYEMIANEKRG
ncbi:diphthine--ammonia ligase [Thaumasiovibrio sp. DFM-14]|uniref:Dph6-related ATP pyrophosphatase n=1 Tax=Thaumasiovibrio sp. DFM-14 TaxID=3384792 RepID=UPI0039A01749